MSKHLDDTPELEEVTGLAAIKGAIRGAGMFSIGVFVGTVYGSFVSTVVAYFILEIATY